MEEIQALFQGFAVALSPVNVGLMFLGVVLGVIIGGIVVSMYLPIFKLGAVV